MHSCMLPCCTKSCCIRGELVPLYDDIPGIGNDTWHTLQQYHRSSDVLVSYNTRYVLNRLERAKELLTTSKAGGCGARGSPCATRTSARSHQKSITSATGHGHRASKVACCQLSAFRTQFYTPSKKTAYRRERAAARSSSCKCRGGKGGQINIIPASSIAHTQVPNAVATQSLLRAECPKPHRMLAVGCDGTCSYQTINSINIRSPGQRFSDLGTRIYPPQHRTISGDVSSPSDAPRPCQLPCADSPW